MAKLRGVNLGGWLVLERWITPSLFDGLKAQDETAFCLELDSKAKEVLHKHWQTYITKDDFVWIAKHGFNAVRIPVGHWLFGNVKPYVGSIDRLDWAMETAKKCNLKVVIDLHTAPGGHNGWDHSGLTGVMKWHTSLEHRIQTLDVLEKLAARYCHYQHLIGIELLNEPHSEIHKDILLDFYRQGYERVRKHCDARVAVIIHDSFRPFEWKGAFPKPEFTNVIIDSHLYQCFSEEDKKRGVWEHFKIAAWDRANQIHQMQKDLPVIVGEWSLALDAQSLRGWKGYFHSLALEIFALGQLFGYRKSAGWFFWTYKTENMGGWGLRECIENGWL